MKTRHLGWDHAGLGRRRWWYRLRAAHLLRLLSSGQTEAASVVLGVLAVVSAGFFYAFPIDAIRALDPGPRALLLLAAFAVLVGSSVIGMAISAYVSLRSLSPEQYATITIGGRPLPEVLKTLAFEVRYACWLFVRSAEPLEAFTREGLAQQDPKQLLHSIQKHHVAIDQALHRFNADLPRQSVLLQRLLEMKRVAAGTLAVPRHRFCDYIIQYSPYLQREYTRKYLANWKEILLVLDQQNPIPVQRLLPLAQQNKRVLDQAYKRMTLQDQVFLNQDLLEFVGGFTAQRSSSGSMLRYAQGLSLIAQDAEARLRDSPCGDDDPDYIRQQNRFRFFYDKQRAYAGVGLHITCLNVCKGILARRNGEPANVGSPATVARSMEVLELLHKDRLQPPGQRIQFLITQAVGQAARQAHIRDSLRSLASFGTLVAEHLEACRASIARRFRSALAQWIRNPAPAGGRFLITYGYSKTVREALKRVLPRLGSAVPRTLVMTSDEEDQLDTRKMIFELTEDRAVVLDVASANERILLALLDQPADVWILLGADAFDNRGRVVHPRGTAPRVRELKNDLLASGHRCEVTVLAESFKHLAGNLLDQPDFVRYHLDRLEIYQSAGPHPLVDRIITDTDPVAPAADTLPAASVPGRAVLAPHGSGVRPIHREIALPSRDAASIEPILALLRHRMTAITASYRSVPDNCVVMISVPGGDPGVLDAAENLLRTLVSLVQS